MAATKPSEASLVEISEDVLCQELEGEAVLLNLKSSIYLGLDPVGTRVWQLLQEHKTLGKVVDAMLREYDVAADRCAQDVFDLVAQMEAQGLLRLG
jgi:hypothetical protein